MEENIIFTRKYSAPEINEKELWRYAGFNGVPASDSSELLLLCHEVIKDLSDSLSYKVCFREFDVLPLQSESKDIKRLLCDCEKVIIFAATIGLSVDRYIAKFGRISPTKALLCQAFGTERIESLCDAFCDDIKSDVSKNDHTITPRFSPGYGDLELSLQNQIFNLLDCHRQLGMSLNSSLLMSPSKSVTAIFGIKKASTENKATAVKCNGCKKIDCEYRRITDNN